MKRAKKITAILLCIAMLLGIGATSAFALEIGETVSWYINDVEANYETTESYLYGGTISEGSNDVEDLGSPYKVCYEFDVTKTGYYKITMSSDEIWGIRATDSYTGNSAKDFKYCVWFDDDKEDVRIFKLSEGKHLIGVSFYSSNPAACELKIEYIAEGIEDIILNEKAFKDLIFNSDFNYDYYEWESNECYYYENYTILFSNGKSIEVKYDGTNDLKFVPKSGDWVEGENILTATVIDFEKEVTATAYPITHFVESIEIPTIDEHLTVREYYYGNDYPDFGYDKAEEVIVTFTDGTKKSFTYHNDHDEFLDADITLPNGREVYIDSTHHYNNDTGKHVFNVQIAGHTYISEECKFEKADFTDNLSALGDNLVHCFEMYYNNFSWYIDVIKNSDNIEDVIRGIGFILGSDLFKNIGNEISEFINYYIRYSAYGA